MPGNDNFVSWKQFDAEWYRKRYALTLSDEARKATSERLGQMWQEGLFEGHSPNRYFDEEWYLLSNPSVRRSVQQGGIFETGFQHYCDIGYRRGAPHWLFSEEEYFSRNPDLGFWQVLDMGCANGYDHFIKYGDREKRPASIFFNHDLFIRSCLAEKIDFDFQQGAVTQYLALDDTGRSLVRTSWYFDPRWYLERYPEVIKFLEERHYCSPLHHYLCQSHAERYDPNPWFSESWYLERYPDVRAALAQGQIRNGYEHFLRSGAREERQPHPDVNLREFARGFNRPGNYERFLPGDDTVDIFALWVKYRELGLSAIQEEPDYDQGKALAIKRVEAQLPAIFRAPLIFDEAAGMPGGKADLSIIILSPGDYFSSFASLIAVYEQDIPLMEVMVVSTGNETERRYLEAGCRGISFFYPGTGDKPDDGENRFTLAGLAYQAIRKARGDIVLFLIAGVQPLYGTCQEILRALKKWPYISGGGGKIIDVNGHVREAGCALWRDGSVTPFGRGAAINALSICSVRRADSFCEGGFFAQRQALLDIFPMLEASRIRIDFRSLSLALRNAGKNLLYLPNLLLRNLNSPDMLSHNEEETRRRLRTAFPHFLAHQPPAVSGIPANPGKPYFPLRLRHRPLAVFICPLLPRRQRGGHATRFFEHLEALLALGWAVTVISLTQGGEDYLTIPLDYPENVECLVAYKDISAFLKSREGLISLLWIIGTPTFANILPMLETNPDLLPQTGLILDTVAMDGRGLRSVENHLRRLVGQQDNQSLLEEETRNELAGAWLCQAILATDHEEEALIRRVGHGVVRVMPASLRHDFIPPSVVPGFSEREGLLFALPVYESGDPGHDAFDWFCLMVIPILRELLPDDMPIWVGNFHEKSINVGFYDRFATLEGLSNPRPFGELLQRCRILVAPARVMNTQSSDLIEAAASGIPMVLSAVLYDRLGLPDQEAVLDGGFSDPARFARAVADLYTDETLWKKLSANARNMAVQHYNYTDWLPQFEEIISFARAETQNSPDALPFPPLPGHDRFEPAPLRFVAIHHNKAEDHSDPAPDREEDEVVVMRTRLGVSLDHET